MSAGYRQKLLNWLTSMGLVILITNLCMATYWFLNWPHGSNRAESSFTSHKLNLIDWAGPIGTWLYVFIPGFIVCALWHGFDLLQRRPAEGFPAALFSEYRVFSSLLVVSGVLFILYASGEFLYNSCSDLPPNDPARFGFDACPTMPAGWLTWSSGIAMLSLVTLSVGKGIVAMATRLTRAR